jgi:FG-GAP repeat protein/VCBS repeat protein
MMFWMRAAVGMTLLPLALPGAPSTAVQSTAIQGLAREEYDFRALAEGVWSAPNRAQELRSRVSADGLELVARGADAERAPWTLRLRTTDLGSADAPLALAPATLTVAGPRAALERAGLTEWLENTARGLEHGYTIAAAPAGAEPLWIGLEPSGLALRIDEGGRSSVLVDARGEPRLRQRELRVTDATGRELDVRLASSPAGVGIRVAAAGASYPLRVSSLLTGPDWRVDGEQSGARLGSSVAPAGDVNGDGFSDVLVGAPLFDGGHLDEGRAALYLGSSTGLATSPAWTAEGEQAGANFGHALFTAGDVNGDGFSDVIVGAPRHDAGLADEGRAYVYLGSPGGLGASAAWTAQGSQFSELFGQSVATAGDVNGDFFSDVVVGAPLFDNGQFNEGRASLYLGSPTGLATSPAWTAESDQAGTFQDPTQFGASVAPAGDVDGDGYGDVLVGAPGFDAGQTNEGRAFLYHGSSLGLSAGPVWTAEGDQASARLGHAVAPAGDVNGDGCGDVLVGAPFFDGGQLDEGRALLFLGSSTGLAASPGWSVEGEQVQAHLGAALATAGDVNGDAFGDVLVGAPEFDGGSQDEGQVRLYLGASAGLATSSSLERNGEQLAAFLGFALATAGDVNGDGYGDWLAGAPGLDAGQADEGRATVRHGSAGTLAPLPEWTPDAAATLGLEGAVASAGDVDGDGYGDVLVGLRRFGPPVTFRGRALLFRGSLAGLATTPAWILAGEADFRELGRSVAGAGDVNGDGYDDVLVADIPFPGRRVRLFLGSPAGLATDAAWSEEVPDFEFGQALSAAGDVNGDGFGDVVVGAPSPGFPVNEGKAFLYLGSAKGLSAAPSWSVTKGPEFGWAVTSADVNADGFSDVLVSDNRGGVAEAGVVELYLGSGAGLATLPAWSVSGEQAGAWLGTSISTAGDVNGDGFGDVLLGAPNFSQVPGSLTREGRAYLHLGSAAGLAASPAWIAESFVTGAHLGLRVATAGDVNADGHADVLVGVERSGTLANAARVYLHLGSASGLAAAPAWGSAEPPVAGFFETAGPAGDVNGDGYADVVVEGIGGGSTAHAYLGNEGRGGRLIGLQQRRKSGDHPIALLGLTRADGIFRLRGELPKHLAGLGWAGPGPGAMLQWELEPQGEPFDGQDLGSSPFPTPLAPPGGRLGLEELASTRFDPPRLHDMHGELFHWRARFVTSCPLQPCTAWFTMPGNSMGEAKLRRAVGRPR